MLTAAFCIDPADVIPWPDDPTLHATVRSHLAPDSRVSIQPSGEIGHRPNNTEIGPWELAYVEDGKLVWKFDGYPTGAFALPLAKR